MGDVLTFTPRPSVVVPAEPVPMTEVEIRTRLGEALQTALDAADHIIAVLDHIDGDVDRDDGGDAERALTAPESHHGSQIVWLRGNDANREAEAAEVVVPDVVAAHPVVMLTVLPWRGSGNVVAAAGVALFEMVAGR
jgi:nucleoside 2-deoxyribosyltransferase